MNKCKIQTNIHPALNDEKVQKKLAPLPHIHTKSQDNFLSPKENYPLDYRYKLWRPYILSYVVFILAGRNQCYNGGKIISYLRIHSLGATKNYLPTLKVRGWPGFSRTIRIFNEIKNFSSEIRYQLKYNIFKVSF